MLRLQLVQLVREQSLPVAQAARRLGVSRDTAYRWLARYDLDPHAPLTDRSRRPHACPHQSSDQVECLVLDARRRFGWGARKIHAMLGAKGHTLPSVRTVHAILRRHGVIQHPPESPAPILRFERANPNELWQMDHKYSPEIARARRSLLTILDDHSRYLLRLATVQDRTVTTAFAVLWNLMGEVGMPEAILSDNAFSTTFTSPATLSWFDANLICLGIRPIHGRPYHPQTQGKVERLHGTLDREFFPRARTHTMQAYLRDVQRWTALYNTVRPHQAIGDVPPDQRWCPSHRRRPAKVPQPQYPTGSVLRMVSTVGDIRWKSRRIMAGRGLVGRCVRVQEGPDTVDLYFADYKLRSIRLDLPKTKAML